MSLALMAFVVGILIGAALAAVAGALYVEHARRQIVETRQNEVSEKVAQMEQELGNLKRVAGNKLYRAALEDVGFGAVQAALRLSVALEEIETAQRILAPHLDRWKK